MKREPHFLDVEWVLAIHARVIADHGGDGGLRDLGMLESAVRLPRATFDQELFHRSVPEMAAAYLFHLCMNHPFLDGNKRTAIAVAEVFLDLNGQELSIDEDETFEMVMAVAAGNMLKREVVGHFVAHCRAISNE